MMSLLTKGELDGLQTYLESHAPNGVRIGYDYINRCLKHSCETLFKEVNGSIGKHDPDSSVFVYTIAFPTTIEQEEQIELIEKGEYLIEFPDRGLETGTALTLVKKAFDLPRSVLKNLDLLESHGILDKIRKQNQYVAGLMKLIF